jgi:hypothetical protein
MQSMQRQFGKLWNKGPGENAKVAVLLKDYEDANEVLAKVLQELAWHGCPGHNQLTSHLDRRQREDVEGFLGFPCE